MKVKQQWEHVARDGKIAGNPSLKVTNTGRSDLHIE